MEANPAQALQLDEVVHQRVRLGILALLYERQRTHFTAIRDALGQNDGSLSRHLSVLQDAGYVQIEKGYADNKPRTWVELTDTGRVAVNEQLATLRDLMSQFEGRTELGAMFAFGVLLQEPDDRQEVQPVPGLAQVMLQTTDLPDGMQIDAPSGPVNQFGEGPPLPARVEGLRDPAETMRMIDGHRRRQIELGIVGGYVRRWVRGDENAWVSIGLHEFAGDGAARRYANDYLIADAGKSPDEAPSEDFIATARWANRMQVFHGFAVGPIACTLTVGHAQPDGEPELMALAKQLAAGQRSRLEHANLERIPT